MRLKCKVWLEKDGKLCFGAGRARILKAVDQTGSLNAAARELGLSYRHAWSQIHTAEQRLGEPLLLRTRGGNRRGGAELTDYAREVMRRFESLEREVRDFTDRRFAEWGMVDG